jgi:hypothetical protein
MSKFSIQVRCLTYVEQWVEVDAPDLESACKQALTEASKDGEWCSSDIFGTDFVSDAHTGSIDDYHDGKSGESLTIPTDYAQPASEIDVL